ncbi:MULTISPECIES: molybdopterin-dependent oxidoreductase [unclassified Deinococcus]|uniref:molybdopterin-dependent oxidoreductase n=1 Tax=unclassified Deinococcus TaxID=2623546 RepID=UPI001E6125D1
MFPRNPHPQSRFRVWRRLGLITLLTLAPVMAGQVSPASKTRLPAFTYVRAAQPTPKAKPGERRALTISTGQRELNLTLGQLQAMPAVRYTTHHPQLKRSFTYEGVTLRDLAARGGFLGRDLRVYAANGFASTIRAEDYMNWPIMLAYRADGAPIPILQKGPLTVVLPERPERFHAGEYSAAWVWFAERIAPAQ